MPSFGTLGQFFKIPPFSTQKLHSAGVGGVPEIFHSCYGRTQKDAYGTQPDGLKVSTQQIKTVFHILQSQQISNCLSKQYHHQEKTFQHCPSPNQIIPGSLLDRYGGEESFQDNLVPAPPTRPVDNEWGTLQPNPITQPMLSPPYISRFR